MLILIIPILFEKEHIPEQGKPKAANPDNKLDIKTAENESELNLHSNFPETLYDLILFTHKFLDTNSSLIYKVDYENKEFVLENKFCKSGNLFNERISFSSGVLSGIFKEKCLISMSPIQETYHGLSYYKESIRPDVKSFLGFPIFNDNKEIIAIAANDSFCPKMTTKRNDTRVKLLINLFSSLYNEKKRTKTLVFMANEIKNLYESSKDLSSHIYTNDITKELIKAVKTTCNIDFGAIILHDSDKGENKIMIVHEDNKDLPEYENLNFSFDPATSLASWVIKNNRSLHYKNIIEAKKEVIIFDRSLPFNHGLNSLLIVPLFTTAGNIGSMAVGSYENDEFSENEINMIEVIAKQTSFSIQNSRLFEKMETLATTDSMTGLYNHRYFQETFEQNLARAHRFSEKISLMFLDIDYFKSINDTYGHIYGDKVLKKISSVIKSSIRKIDIASRYGGEEFAVILPNTGKKEANNLGERIRQNVEIERFDGSLRELKVTISAGISTFPDDSEKRSELISKADKALYYAKENGRNKCFLYDKIRT
ncbi:MAG: sensor domain-containing diguanylate cyclase [Pseudomonadota bacterium]